MGPGITFILYFQQKFHQHIQRSIISESGPVWSFPPEQGVYLRFLKKMYLFQSSVADPDPEDSGRFEHPDSDL